MDIFEVLYYAITIYTLAKENIQTASLLAHFIVAIHPVS